MDQKYHRDSSSQNESPGSFGLSSQYVAGMNNLHDQQQYPDYDGRESVHSQAFSHGPVGSDRYEANSMHGDQTLLSGQYSGPVMYSDNYASGLPQVPPYSNTEQPYTGRRSSQQNDTTEQYAQLSVIQNMIMNDLSSVRSKIVQYMDSSRRSTSQYGSDTVDHGSRLQEQLAQLENAQYELDMQVQRDFGSLPPAADYSQLYSQQSRDWSESMSEQGVSREIAIENAIQRLQTQQQLMSSTMDQMLERGQGEQQRYGQYSTPQYAPQQISGSVVDINESMIDQNDKQVDDEDTEVVEEPDPYDAKPFHRQTRINWTGLVVFLLFILAFFLYVFIRIRYTLNIGIWVWYGSIVLAGEIIGALAVLLYAMCIVVQPLAKQKSGPAQKPKYKYHIRVVVPCYSESLAILQRTIMAAYNATLPPGCTRTLYLCDDGKDPKKQEWVDSLDADDVVYVSGRKRKPGEMNGKSCNINNCLKQVYPKTPKQGTISMREVICVFDADQVCSTEFFSKTVYLLDSGSDIAMVLSPQCFYNINPGADIFNNSNIHFWEYMQPGYDAMGFISCTGTNFLCRARALQECGWFPEDTVTEDFGLGIQLTKLGWKCRYVQEYLAIGEAPEEVRNTFQQRSRWCKGHFQIFFSSKCPLFDNGLNLFHRIMSCSSVWSYIVNAITTPLLFIVPIISIWFGVFPIALNFPAALGITVYGFAVFLVQNYNHTFRHLKVLWFANLGNTLLWTVYCKAFINTSIGQLWKGTLTFKTTAKGAGTGRPSAVRDLWIHMVMLFTSFITVIVGLAGLKEDVNLPLVISIIFALYNCVPYYLVIHYAYMGRKNSLKITCLCGMILQAMLQLLGVILVWVLLPRQYDYSKALTLSMMFFETQRSGKLPEAMEPELRRIDWRGDSALNDDGKELRNGDTLIGGLYTGGIDGNVKYTAAIAYSAAMMCWAYASFPQPFAEAKIQGYTLNSIKWATDYLMNAQVMQGSETIGAYEYIGDIENERATWTRPEDISNVREGKFVQHGAHLFADISAALSACHLVIKQTGVKQDYADKLLKHSISAYNKAKADERSKFKGEFVDNGNTLPTFRSKTMYDDLIWASSWLYKVFDGSLPQYKEDLYRFYDIAQQDRLPNKHTFNWDDLFIGANLVMLEADLGEAGSYGDVVESFLEDWVCARPEDIKYTMKGRALNEHGTALGETVAVAALSLKFAKMQNQLKSGSRQKLVGYRCWALSQARWILGDSVKVGQPVSYMVGYGKSWPEHIYDRSSSCPPRPERCSLSDKSTKIMDYNVLSGALIHGPSELVDEYKDIRSEKNEDTHIRLDWNAGVPGLMSGIIDIGGSWAECLQGFGA